MTYEEALEEIKRLKVSLKLSYDIERQTFHDNIEMKNHYDQSTAIRSYVLSVRDILESLYDRLVYDYNGDEIFEQLEEDRLVIGNLLELLDENVG